MRPKKSYYKINDIIKNNIALYSFYAFLFPQLSYSYSILKNAEVVPESVESETGYQVEQISNAITDALGATAIPYVQCLAKKVFVIFKTEAIIYHHVYVISRWG